MGICGPLVSLIAGGIAGYLAIQQEKSTTKNDGAKAGAVAGGIAGGLILVGQIIGAIGALVMMQAMGTQLPFGQVAPPLSGGDPALLMGYYIGGLGSGFCFGIFGAVLAAGAGAAAGYLGTSEQPPVNTSGPYV
jgi:hypothetical protein